MQTSVNRGVSIPLVIIATCLCGLDGLLSLGSSFVFSDNESVHLWATILIPALLWIPAVVSLKFPWAGIAAFVTLLGVSAVTFATLRGVSEQGSVNWEYFFWSHRISLIGGALLLVNLYLVQRGLEET